MTGQIFRQYRQHLRFNRLAPSQLDASGARYLAPGA
jgi:hypothetical protein